MEEGGGEQNRGGEGRGSSRTMSNIAGLFHPWEREPERGGWRARGEGGWNGGRSADPSASLHPRLSATLIFLHGPRSIIPRHIRPLSSLFPPTHPPPPSNQPSSSRLPASNPGPVATLLIAVSKFISGALVGGLPEFSGAEGVIRARVEKAEERGRGGGWVSLGV